MLLMSDIMAFLLQQTSLALKIKMIIINHHHDNKDPNTLPCFLHTICHAECISVIIVSSWYYGSFWDVVFYYLQSNHL